jgi:hypothetical protein
MMKKIAVAFLGLCVAGCFDYSQFSPKIQLGILVGCVLVMIITEWFTFKPILEIFCGSLELGAIFSMAYPQIQQAAEFSVKVILGVSVLVLVLRWNNEYQYLQRKNGEEEE